MFCTRPFLDFGASPDGLVGDDDPVEIKNPATATHIETLLTENRPWQIRHPDAGADGPHRVGVTLVFDPECRVTCSFGVKRCRDPAFMSEMEGEVQAFLPNSPRNWTRDRALRGGRMTRPRPREASALTLCATPAQGGPARR